MMNRKLLAIGLVVLGLCCRRGLAQEAPQKYALLIAVAKYDHAEMNKPEPLQFPEADARAVGKVLETGGYTVELLLGKQATQKAIRDKLKALAKKGSTDGVVLIGLFGHGVETESLGDDKQFVRQGCFCPFDTSVRIATDSQGRTLFGQDKQELLEPDPASLITLAELMSALRVAKAGSRVIFADCCRDTPNRARGRSFGQNFKVQDLPDSTAVFFGCSPNEQAFEHQDWQHGAFTKCLLEELAVLSSQGEVDAGTLAGRLKKAVPALVASVSHGRDKQVPKVLFTDTFDLQLRSQRPPLFDATRTRSAAEAKASQQAWARSLGREPVETNSLKMPLALIPPGEFLMGSTAADLEKVAKFFNAAFAEDEQPQHRVRISRPFYLGIHEVTRGQFAEFVRDQNYKTEAERDGKGGYGFDETTAQFAQKPEYTWRHPGFTQTDDHPVVNVSWNDAEAFADWLSQKEGKRYRLPTEAEWEYACRAGSQGAFQYGDDPEGLARVGNIADGTAKAKFSSWTAISARDGYVFTAPVGQFRPNAFGLYDMHGNVWEWCDDWYDEKAYGGRGQLTTDPVVVKEASDRVLRGGSWSHSAWGCRSAVRCRFGPSNRYIDLGFRLALSPSGE